VAGWLALLCAGTVAGALAADAHLLPEAASPLLVAVAAGVIAQAARISLRVAFRQLRMRALVSSTAATVTAAVVTAVAVHLAG
jgi:hypothetical protein